MNRIVLGEFGVVSKSRINSGVVSWFRVIDRSNGAAYMVVQYSGTLVV